MSGSDPHAAKAVAVLVLIALGATGALALLGLWAPDPVPPSEAIRALLDR